MSLAIDLMLERFHTLYGPPQTDNPEAFVEEYRNALANYHDDIVKAATDKIILEQDKPWWPTPGRCRQVAREVAPKVNEKWQQLRIAAYQREAQRQIEHKRALDDDKPEPEPARVPVDIEVGMIVQRKIAADYAESIEAVERKPLPDVSRPAFEKMQRESPNPGLHMTKAAFQALVEQSLRKEAAE